jgi:hypothetical protein
VIGKLRFKLIYREANFTQTVYINNYYFTFNLSFWGVYRDYNQKRNNYEENEYKSENILVNIFIFWNNGFSSKMVPL